MTEVATLMPQTKPAQLVTRVGTPDDLDELMALSAMACEENGFLNPNPEMLLREIYPALCQDHGIVGVVGPEGGPISGAVLLRISQTWYSADPLIEERAIFVHPDVRKGKWSVQTKMPASYLIEFSKKVSDTLGIPLMIGVLSIHRTAGKVRLYTRHFGEPAGAYFLYGARTGNHSGTEH